MSVTVVALLLLAAALHASWNLLVKQAGKKLVFTWWALCTAFVLYSPVLVFGPHLSLRVWPNILFSTLFEVLYFILLTRGYDRGDFSLVYPIARGTAPALLLLWATFFLGEPPHAAGGLIGFAVLLTGLIVVGGGLAWFQWGRSVGLGGLGTALLVATCISMYSAIDGAAVQHTSPLPYGVLIVGLTAAGAAPVVYARYGRQAMLAEWHVNRRRIILVGVLSQATYSLVLLAFTLARVSYTGAVREVSIVFAAVIGWRWLGEQFGLMRTVGAAMIVVGILTIAIAG
jgi:drug/metabolite transporter (DMT)-like permease